MATTAAALSTIIQEVLGRDIREVYPTVDPVMRRIITSTKNVVPPTEVGRSWLIKKTYFSSGAGVVSFADVSGEDHVQTADVLALRQNAETWQDYRGVPRPAPFQDQIALARLKGLITIDSDLLQVTALPSTIADVVQQKTRGQALAFSYAYQNGMFLTDTTFRSMARVNGSPTTGASNSTNHDTLGDTTTVSIDAGRISNFYIGMRISAVATGSTESSVTYRANSGTTDIWVIKSIDYLGGTLTIVNMGAEGSSSSSSGIDDIVDNDYLCLYASAFGSTGEGRSINGIEVYHKDSGTVRNLSLTTHPQLKSLLTTVSGPLTRRVLLENLGRFAEAYDPLGVMMDTLVTTEGVITTFQANDLNSLTFESNGQPLKSPYGFDDSIVFMHNGKKYELLTSPRVSKGKLYGLKMGDQNWKRYTVPKIDNSSMGVSNYKTHEVPDEIQWIAPALGQPTIWVLVTSGGTKATNVAMAPCEARGQLAPDQVQGMVLSSLTEPSAFL